MITKVTDAQQLVVFAQVVCKGAADAHFEHQLCLAIRLDTISRTHGKEF